MLKKQLAINMVANVFSFLINAGISFVFTPYLINTLGSEAYSFFPLANNFINYTSVITVALNSMASRFITIKIHEHDHEGANTYFNSVLFANTIIAVVLSILSILMVVNIQSILNIPADLIKQVQYLFAFVFIGLIFNILGSVFAVATFAKNRVELSAIKNIQSKIIYIVLLVSTFTLFEPSVAYIGICNLVAVIFIIITNICYTKKLLPEVQLNRRCFELRAIKELISSGIWNTVNQLSTILLTGLDLLISNICLGPGAAGQYAIVQTIPNLIQSLVGTLVGVFVPQFTILYAQKKQEELVKSIDQSIKFMGLLITIPIAFLLIFGDVFYSLWVPGENYEKLYILSNLAIIPMIVTGSINTIFNVYTVTNKLKVPAIVLLITGILNTTVVLVLLNTTELGLFAIPITSMTIGLMRNLIFTPMYAANCLKVKWYTFYKAIGRGVICTLTMIMICYGFKKNLSVDNWITLILVGGISASMALLINSFIVFNKKERQEALQLIRRKRHK